MLTNSRTLSTTGGECDEESVACATRSQHTVRRSLSFLARLSAHDQQTEFLSMPNFFAIASVS